jgi:hypothetical protein
MSSRQAEAPSGQIEIFVRTLRGERHFRRSLLIELVDRLQTAGLPAATNAARDLLDSPDHNAPDFDRRLAALEELVLSRRCNAA